MQQRGSSDSRATTDSHCDTQGSRNEVKCHGNASAEMCFNLGKWHRGKGLMSRRFWYATTWRKKMCVPRVPRYVYVHTWRKKMSLKVKVHVRTFTYIHSYKLAAPMRKAFFWYPFCRANSEPSVTIHEYPAMGFFWGVDRHHVAHYSLDEEPLKKTFFATITIFENENGQNRESLHRMFWFSIAIDRARSNKSGGGPWCSPKSRTARRNRANFYAEKTEKTQFGMKIFTFFSRIACYLRESRSTWQNFRQKQPKKKNFLFVCLSFYSKVGAQRHVRG